MSETSELIEAVTKLIGAVAWPAVVVFALVFFRSSLRRFLAGLSELRLKGSGFEVSVTAAEIQSLGFDATAKRLYAFWKPGGEINAANAARIAVCMRELGVVGSVPWLINAATSEDRARVAARLSLDV